MKKVYLKKAQLTRWTLTLGATRMSPSTAAGPKGPALEEEETSW